jgi:peptidoglycan DL-endopeptidase CwlO
MRNTFSLIFVSLIFNFLGGCASQQAPLKMQHGLWGKALSNAQAPRPGGPLRFASLPFTSKPDAKRTQQVAAVAQQFVKNANSKKSHSYRKDCSGLARAIYKDAGRPLGGSSTYRGENDVSVLYRYSQRHGQLHRNKPQPGDLVFFDNTIDLNRDGDINDLLTHVGVVERINADDTIIFVHQMGPRPVRARMNLRQPQLIQDPKTGKRVNHILRRGKKGEPHKTTASLFAGFASISL